MQDKMLKASGLVVFLLAFLWGTSGSAQAANITVDLCATNGQVTMPDGVEINIWSYVNTGGAPCAPDLATSLPGAEINVAEGDVVTINLTNALNVPTSIIIPGQMLSPSGGGPGLFTRAAAANGGTVSYGFTARAGTYLYQSGTNHEIQVAMGLYGALVVHSTTGAYASVTNDAVVMLSEIDPALHDNPVGFDMREYDPRYWLINGQPFPNSDLIKAAPGDQLLLRYLNAGYHHDSMTLLGTHQTIIASNGFLAPVPTSVVAETVPAGQTLETIVAVGPEICAEYGRIPLYNRNGYLTNDGYGPGGMRTYIGPDSGVRFAQATFEVNEGDGVATITVEIDAVNPTQETTVLFTTNINGNGANAQDYQHVSGTVAIPAGAKQATVTIPINDDSLVELSESLRLELFDLSCGHPIPMDDVELIIHDNDSAVLTIDSESKDERHSGDRNYSFYVMLSNAVDTAIEVGYYTDDDSATVDDDDYKPEDGTLTFSGEAGERQRITVEVNGDTKVELDEIFYVRLTDLDAKGRDVTIADGKGTGKIRNDDDAKLEINNVNQSEGDTGVTEFTFTVELDEEIDTDVTVEYTTADGSALTSNNDYQPTSGTIRFSGREGEKETITVQVVGDTEAELDETFTVELSNIDADGRDVDFADAKGTGKILNDDGVTIRISDAALVEGNSGTQTLLFTVELDGIVSTPISVAYATIDGTATAGEDYSAASGTILLGAAEGNSKSIAVKINGDTKVELDETFAVQLTYTPVVGVEALLAGEQAVGTITNDDNATVTINNVSQHEGNAGTQDFVFDVTLSHAVDNAVSIDYATNDELAEVADSDYSAATGTLNFAGNAGETQTVTVQVNGDTKVELDETFSVELHNLQSGGRDVSLDGSDGEGTIVNDDGNVLTINDVTVLEGDSGQSDAIFTVLLGEASAVEVSVYIEVVANSAAAGDDYASVLGTTLTFAPGEMSKLITVAVIGDNIDEDNETFHIKLSSAVNATILDSLGVGTIVDDDGAVLMASKTANVGTATIDDTIVYNYRVENIGDVAISALSASDDKLGPITLDKSSLAPGEFAAGTLSYVVQLGDLPGPIVNQLVSSGVSAGHSTPDVEAQAEASVDLVDARILLTKTVGIQGVGPECAEASSLQVPEGTTVVYCFTIQNIGEITLTQHSLVDSQLGILLDGHMADLGPGDRLSHTAAAQPSVDVTNVATWTAGVQINVVDLIDTIGVASATVHVSDDDDDQDDDGMTDNEEGSGDMDDDDIPSYLDPDSDNDGILDVNEPGDSNNDGVLDSQDPATPGGVGRAQKSIFLPLLVR